MRVPPSAARHEALSYLGPAAFAPTCVALASDALSHDQPLVLLAANVRLDEVRAEMGEHVDDLALVATDRHGRNPYRIPTLLDSFQAASDGRHPVALADWGLPARSSAVLAEVQVAESLLNGISDRPWTLDVVCLYDTTVLDETMLGGMRRVHPFLRGAEQNPDYDPNLAAALFAAVLAAGPTGGPTLEAGAGDLGRVRATVRDFATAAGLGRERVDDFVIAANEIVTNSVRHGGGRGLVSLWEDGDSVVFEVSDTGYIADPWTGRFAPSPSSASGRGLWLANEICDLVQIRSTPAGTVVRLYVDRP